MRVAGDGGTKLDHIRWRFARFAPIPEAFPDDDFEDEGLPVFQITYHNYEHLLKIAHYAGQLAKKLRDHNCQRSISPEYEQLVDALEEE